MKKNSNIIFILISFLFLLCVNNINAFKSLIFNYSNLSFSFFNIPFLISFLSILILLIIYNYKKIDTKKFIYFSSIVCFYNILSNIFSHFSAFGFLILYLFIIFGTYVTQLIIKKKFEFSIVVFTSILLLVLYFFGVFNLLTYVKYLIIILFLIGSIVVFVKGKSKDIEFFDTGLFIFSILFVVAILGGVGRYIHIWDEFSHWAFDAKVTILSNKLTLYTGMNYSTYSYPPLLSLWHYFVSIFNGGFNEPNLYIGLSIFIFIYMMPMFIYINKKKMNLLTIILYIFLTYSLNFLFDGAYSYSILYADLAMGFLGTSVLILYFYCKNEKINDRFIMLLLFSCISLIKSSGFVLVFTILFLIYLIDYFDIKNRKLNIFKFIKKYYISILFMCIILSIWALCVYKSNYLNDYNFTLLPISLKTNIGLKMNKEFILKFFTNLVLSFDSSILFSFLNIPLFAFIIVLMYGIVYLNKVLFKEFSFKYSVSFLLSYIVFFILTALSVLVMLSVFEAGELHSFGRYLNCYHLIMINYILFMFYYLTIKTGKYLNCFLTILVILMLFIPFSKSMYFFTDFDERYHTQVLSNSRKDHFNEVISKTPEHSKIYVIDQKDEDSMMNLWYARYYCYPRKVSAHNMAINWKVLTKSNEWDLSDWGFTFETFREHLNEYKYEYLFLNTVTDEFVEGMSDEFNIDSSIIKNNRLFKIDTSNSDVKLELVDG